MEDRDRFFTENPMVVDAYWEDRGYRTMYPAHEPTLECDRCGAIIYKDDDSFELEGDTLCCECWAAHEECVGEEEEEEE